jgi:hypothetical protein
MVGLLFLLILLVFLYVWIFHSKTVSRQPVMVSPDPPAVTFESFQSMIKSPSSTKEELNMAVDMILERYGMIGEGGHPLRIYELLIEMLCLHPNTDAKMVLRFEKGLRTANPKYINEIERSLAQGLRIRRK